jgi:hypothetical protein
LKRAAGSMAPLLPLGLLWKCLRPAERGARGVIRRISEAENMGDGDGAREAHARGMSEAQTCSCYDCDEENASRVAGKWSGWKRRGGGGGETGSGREGAGGAVALGKGRRGPVGAMRCGPVGPVGAMRRARPLL